MFLTLGMVGSNISIIKNFPGYWDYINRAFRNEIYVTVMFKVPQWFLNSIHFGEFYSMIPVLIALRLWLEVVFVRVNLVCADYQIAR